MTLRLLWKWRRFLKKWDQTGINYVPVSQWTMAQKGYKKVEVVGLTDKRQITAHFGAIFFLMNLMAKQHFSRAIRSDM